MGVLVQSHINLECPSCGKTGVASILSGPSGCPRAASAPEGFLIRIAPDISFEIACSCGACAYKLASRTTVSDQSVAPAIGPRGRWLRPWMLWFQRQSKQPGGRSQQAALFPHALRLFAPVRQRYGVSGKDRDVISKPGITGRRAAPPFAAAGTAARSPPTPAELL
jgi:hypothetical protein